MRQSFPVSNAGLADAFGYLDAKIRAFGLDGALAHRLSVILDEVCANMIRHDDSLGPSSNFTLELNGHEDGIELTIIDPGQPFNPLEFRHAEQPEIGGHGITLVKGLANAVSYERADGNNRLTVQISAQ